MICHPLRRHPVIPLGHHLAIPLERHLTIPLEHRLIIPLEPSGYPTNPPTEAPYTLSPISSPTEAPYTLGPSSPPVNVPTTQTPIWNTMKDTITPWVMDTATVVLIVIIVSVSCLILLSIAAISLYLHLEKRKKRKDNVQHIAAAKSVKQERKGSDINNGSSDSEELYEAVEDTTSGNVTLQKTQTRTKHKKKADNNLKITQEGVKDDHEEDEVTQTTQGVT
eukprot:679687_1